MAAVVITHPAVERMALRRRMALMVEGLLDAVDVLLRELAKDEPDADLEPSLGAPVHPAHLARGEGWRIPPGVFDWSRGANDDREADGERWTVGDADEEPSLGALPVMDQRRWAGGSTSDVEREHDGREPSLGSVAVERWSDQRHWAQGDHADREKACEGDQRPPGTYAGQTLDPDDVPGEDVTSHSASHPQRARVAARPTFPGRCS